MVAQSNITVAEGSPRPAPELARLLRFWIAALRLDEWRLELALGNEQEMGQEMGMEVVAFVRFSATHKSATVTLRRFTEPDADLEEDLVHELLHLVFIGSSAHHLESAPEDEIPFEFGLNAVAETLVKMRRAFTEGKRIRPRRSTK